MSPRPTPAGTPFLLFLQDSIRQPGRPPLACPACPTHFRWPPSLLCKTPTRPVLPTGLGGPGGQRPILFQRKDSEGLLKQTGAGQRQGLLFTWRWLGELPQAAGDSDCPHSEHNRLWNKELSNIAIISFNCCAEMGLGNSKLTAWLTLRAKLGTRLACW